jgi:adenosine kinase
LIKYVLPPNSVVYTGCVGDDEFADKLRNANQHEGLQSAYLVKKGAKTGRCAVIITGHHRYVVLRFHSFPKHSLRKIRSLVTDLQAAEKYDINYISSEALTPLIDAAKVFYVEGFFLTHGTDIVLDLATKASVSGKVGPII